MGYEALLEPVPGVEPTKGGIYLWRYVPNVGAAALFLILFIAAFLYICFKIWKTKARFCIVFAIGCFLELVAFGVRASARNNTGKLMPYCIQNVFLLIAPVLFAATIYMMLGRIISRTGGDRYSLINPTKITLIFVLGDVVSFVVQAGGAGMSVVQNANISKWADRVIIIGLFIQIIIFGFFCALAVIFQRRMRRASQSSAMLSNSGVVSEGAWIWEYDIYLLYTLSFLIMVRSIFRVVEYCQGQTGYALSHEWTLYVFDSLLMIIVAALFCWKFPGHLSTRAKKQQPQPTFQMSASQLKA